LLCGQGPADAEPQDSVAPVKEEPVSVVERAQAHREAGELEQALALIDEAVLAEPDFAPLYLYRGQLQAEMATRAEGLERSRLLTAAAADLDRYLSRSPGEPAPEMLQQRDDLLVQAEEARREALSTPVEPPAEPLPKLPNDPPAPTEVDVSPPPFVPSPVQDVRRDRVAPAMWTAAGVLAVTGAVVGSASFVVEQRCDDLCEADVQPRPGPLSVAVGSTAVATGLATWGTYRWAQRAPRSQRRVMTIVTGTLGASAAVATVVTGVLASTGWGGATPSADRDLAGVQRLTNAAMASGVFVAPLLSTALVSALAPSSPRRATARR
jgi:hypothetical protein